MELPGHERLVPLAPAHTPEQQWAAAKAVAARCTDADDCRELLDMLGLREELVAS
jgi:hypothetical protein